MENDTYLHCCELEYLLKVQVQKAAIERLAKEVYKPKKAKKKKK